MELNAVQQYRSSSNGALPGTPTQPRNAAQMMYPFGNLSLQHTGNSAQYSPQATKTSQPFGTWSSAQNQSAYTPPQQPAGASAPESCLPPQGLPNSGMAALRDAGTTSQLFPPPNAQQQNMQTTDYFQDLIMETSSWGHKACEALDIPAWDQEVPEMNQGLINQDENAPVIDLRQYSGLEYEAELPTFSTPSARRMSESSFSMSSTGALADLSASEDLPASEAISYASDCEAWSNLEPPPNPLSPTASPRRPELMRSGSRSRASPSPHMNVRSSPYTMDSTRLKRWSTGVAPTTSNNANAVQKAQNRYSMYVGPPRNPHNSLPAYTFSNLLNFQSHTQNILFSQPPPLPSTTSAPLFTQMEQPMQLEIPRPLPSQGLFRLLQSNADRHTGCTSHFADLSDPPDLFSSLHDEPSSPPESDMKTTDPDLVPHEQDLRFTGDLYTPRWVRGHGNKREGWCGLCKPGRWLVLKNSAFWYDKSFTHGISAATGAAFQGPQETRRTEGNLDVWEGLCGSCGDWVPLVSSKKKGTTWFRHAYKCHTHPKTKDGARRRREPPALPRNRATSATSASASSSHQPCINDPGQDGNRSMNGSVSPAHASAPTSAIKSEFPGGPLRASQSQPPNGAMHPMNQHHEMAMAYGELVGIGNGTRAMNPLQGLASMI